MALLRPDQCHATDRHKQDRQHSGLMDAYGEPYPELKTVVRACAEEMYAIANGGV
jgi:hypothetical protein